MLATKRASMVRNIGRLTSGLVTLRKTNSDVEALKEDLKVRGWGWGYGYGYG